MDIRGSHNVNKILMTYQFLSLVSLQADRKKKKKGMPKTQYSLVSAKPRMKHDSFYFSSRRSSGAQMFASPS